MIQDRNRIYDGFDSLEAGVDGGRPPDTLDPNQCAAAENMTFRGGKATTRPGFRLLSETFANPDHSYYADGTDALEVVVEGEQASQIYKSGIFQGAQVYNPHAGIGDCIMALIGGRLFKITPGVQSAKVTDISLPKRNSKKWSLAYMLQEDKWLIAQDGDSKPILYDGDVARRADNANTDREKKEVALGTIMAGGMGRICVTVNQRDIAFGDLYGSHALPDPADSLPFFTERNFLSEGFDAAIPFQQGAVTGLAFFPQLDTSTGNGQLLAFAGKGASSFFLSLPREQWKTSQFQILALKTTGMRGHRSVSEVNEDLWFRAYDGARTYRQARSESQGWAHIPLSTNVRQFFGSDTPQWLKYCSSILFDNRIIFTCSPYWNGGRPYHNGMVVVDFDILSSFGQKYKPAWDGHWTKMRISQLLVGSFDGVDRAFIFGLNDQDENQLYEISLDDQEDWDGPIDWSLETRSFGFKGQSTPFTENELYDADLWVREITRINDLRAFYKPDNYPEWIAWKNFEEGHFQLIGDIGALGPGGIPSARTGFVPRASFGKPRDEYDPTTRRRTRRGFEFQVKLQGSGHLVIDRFRIHGQKLTENAKAA